MTYTYNITGMHCENCVGKVSNALQKTEGVLSANVTLNPPKAKIEMSEHISLVRLNSTLIPLGDYRLKETEPDYIPALKYDWLTKFFDPLLRITMPEKRFKTDLIKQANIAPHHRVLDFGCGSLTLTLLAKQNEPKADFTGVDVDEKILSIAKKKNEKSNTKIHIDKYDGVILPYPDSYFDRVITSLVFHHLTAAQKVNSLREIKRILKPDGELHIADWGKAQNILMRFLFLFVQLLDGFKTTTDNVKGLLPNYISSAGFKNVKITKNYSTIFGTLSLFSITKT